MSKTDESENTSIVRVEVVAPEDPARPRITPADAQAMIKAAIERQVAEILARRDDLIFQPFFTSRKISDELRRLQTVPEHEKWAVYFGRYGCLVCGTRQDIHAACGMCSNCRSKVRSRLQTCIKLAERDRREWKDIYRDQEELARQALSGDQGTPALPPSTEVPQEETAIARRKR